jgi:hypothetical protein
MKCRQCKTWHIALATIAVIAATLGIANDVHAQGKIRIAVTAF